MYDTTCASIKKRDYQILGVRKSNPALSAKIWIPILVIVGVVIIIITLTLLQRPKWQVPLLPQDSTPAICFRCDNYYNLLEGRRVNALHDVKHVGQKKGEIVGAGGIASALRQEESELCTETVNHSALVKFKSSSDDCGDSWFNGCFKMITKSYRVASGVGREELIITVVTRNCAEISDSTPLGCQYIRGGAGMVRVLCFCKGNYCNSAKIQSSRQRYFFTYLLIYLILLQRYSLL